MAWTLTICHVTSTRCPVAADWDDRLFLDMCILSGCDYLPSISGMGLKTAHKYLKRYGSTENVIRVLKVRDRVGDRAGDGRPVVASEECPGRQ